MKFNICYVTQGLLLFANNNIRIFLLEIKNDRCKIVKLLIFRSLSREHFRERERNISILTILHLSFLISNMKLLILLFAVKLFARLSIFHPKKNRLINSVCFRLQLIKKKGIHGNYRVKVHSRKFSA